MFPKWHILNLYAIEENRSCTGAREGQIVPISYKTPAVVLKVKSGKSLVLDRGKINLRKRHKIHCYLRIGYFVAVTYFVM